MTDEPIDEGDEPWVPARVDADHIRIQFGGPDPVSGDWYDGVVVIGRDDPKWAEYDALLTAREEAAAG